VNRTLGGSEGSTDKIKINETKRTVKHYLARISAFFSSCSSMHFVFPGR
jgi:hypothetical protein